MARKKVTPAPRPQSPGMMARILPPLGFILAFSLLASLIPGAAIKLVCTTIAYAFMFIAIFRSLSTAWELALSLPET